MQSALMALVDHARKVSASGDIFEAVRAQDGGRRRPCQRRLLAGLLGRIRWSGWGPEPARSASLP